MRLLLPVLLLLATLSAFAQTIRYVSTTGTNANPTTATSWATSTADLQGAIDASQPGDQVWVRSGVYKPGGDNNRDRTISFAMKDGVAIYGGFTGSETALSQRPTINAVASQPSGSILTGDLLGNDDRVYFTGFNDNSYHVIVNPRGLTTSAILDGFVVQSGYGSGVNAQGGGVFNNGWASVCSPTFRNCSFQNNIVDGGRGSNTVVARGAAMYNDGHSGGQSSPVILNCSFSGNIAIGNTGYGGAIFNDATYGAQQSAPVIINAVFYNNQASERGGAIFNTSDGGGTMSLQLTNCSFIANNAGSRAGVMFTSTQFAGRINVQLTNCSLRDNSGGVLTLATDRGTGAQANAQLTNCVVWNNGGNNTFYVDGTSAVQATYSFLDNTTNANVSGPGNVTLTANPFARANATELPPCSPLLGGANVAAYNAVNGPATDLLGNPRIIQGRLDPGAEQYTGLDVPTTVPPANFTARPQNLSSILISWTVTPISSQTLTVSTSPSMSNASVLALSSPTASSFVHTGLSFGTTYYYRLTASNACNTVGPVSASASPGPNRLFVRASATGGNTGLSWADAFTDLQSALRYANTGALTEIWVAAGTYKPTGTPDRTGTDRNQRFAMLPGVAIYGGFVGNETALSQRPAINPVTAEGRPGQPSSTTLSGDLLGNDGVFPDFSFSSDNSYHVIVNPPGLTTSAVLDGFVVRGGFASGSNDDRTGGGMFNDGRGGVCNPTLRNCLFTNNAALTGGAIYNNGTNGQASPQLTNCAFVRNLGSSLGGAMVNIGNSSGLSNPQLTNCLFLGNTASSGGALYNESFQGQASAQLTNCAFIGNSASPSGAALANLGSSTQIPMRLINCSFQGNVASQGGVLVNDGNSETSRPQLINCVAWGNGPAPFVVISLSRPVATYSLFDNTTNVDVSGLGNLTTPTSPFSSATSVALASGSSALNAGNLAAYNAANGPATDLLGNPRLIGATIDMGAIETPCAAPNVPIVVTQQPASSSAVCVGGSVNVPVSVTGTVTAYQWYKDSQLLSGQTSATLTLTNVQVADGGSYSVVVTGTCNSLTSSAFSLTVGTPPTVMLSGSAVCGTGGVSLSATSGLSSYTFVGPGGGVVTTGTSATALAINVPTGLQTFTVVAATSIGCSASATVQVDATIPVAGAVITNSNGSTTFCQGTPVGFGGSGGGTYLWTGPNSFTSTQQNPVISNAQPAATGTYTLVVTAANGCTSSTTIAITVNPNPSTLALASTVVCGTGSVRLSATSGLGSYTFVGSGGGPSGGGPAGGVIASGTSNTATATNVPSGIQTFTVIAGNLGCTASATATVNTEVPVAGVAVSNTTTSFCQSQSIGFSGSGGGMYLWTGPNSFSSTQQNPTITFNAQLAATGTYTLVVTAANGCTSSTTIAITVNPNPPTPSISNAQGMFCGGSSVELTTTPQAGIVYSWHHDYLPFIPTTAPIATGTSVTATKSGYYTCTATSITTNCQARLNTYIDIADLVYTGNLGSGDPQQTGRLSRLGGVSTCVNSKTACPGVFTTTGARAYDAYPIVNKRNVPVCVPIGLRSGCGNNIFNAAYLTSFDPANPCANFLGDPGSSFGAVYMEVTIPANGTAIVVVHEVNGGSGCSSYTLTADMPRDPADITMLPSSGTICGGTTATLVAPLADSYAWTGPAITGATSRTVNPAPIAPTTYSVTLGYGNNGCTNTLSKLVDVQSVTATVTANPSATLTCAPPGSPAGLTLTASGATSYTFTGPSNFLQQGSTAIVNAPGTYTLTVANVAGCRSQTTIAISSDQTAPANASLSASNSGTLTCSITSLTLTASATPTSMAGTSGTPPGFTYTFRGPDGTLSGNGDTRIISTPGTYSVIITGANGCTALATTTVVSNTSAPTGVSLTPAPSSTLTCATQSITLTAATGTGLTYAFAGPAGTLAGTGLTREISAPGTYTVTVTGANGCSATSTTVISQNIVTPTASLTTSTGSLTFCANSSLTLVAGTGASYRFSAGANQIGGSTGNTATVNATGTYSVTVTGANGCTSTASISVSAIAATTITNPLPSTQTFCEGESVPGLLVMATGANLTYQWYKGTMPLAGKTTNVLTFTTASSGDYYVVVSGTCGIVSSNTMVLTVRPRPAAPTLAPTSRTVVAAPAPATISLTPFVMATGTLSFSGANGLLNPPNADISIAGTFSFSVTQTNSFGCTSPATPFSLSVLSPLPPTSQSVCRGSNVILNVLPTGTRYQWFRHASMTSPGARLTEVASLYRGTTTASLTLVSVQTTGYYSCQVTQANETVQTFGPYAVNVTLCGAREAVTEPELAIQVRVAPNPLVDNVLRATITGAGGQRLTVSLTDQQGRIVQEQQWQEAEEQQRIEWNVGTLPAGTLLFQATTDRQHQTVKVMKE